MEIEITDYGLLYTDNIFCGNEGNSKPFLRLYRIHLGITTKTIFGSAG